MIAENLITVESALMVGVGALSASVVFLFKRIDREIERCDRDRRQLWERIVALEALSCTMPNCPARQAVRSMGPVVPMTEKPTKT